MRLTPRGREVIDQAVSDHLANEARLLSGLSAEQRPTLADLLREFDASLEDG